MPQIRSKGVFQQQPDAVLSQANPVSGTLYTVLVTTKNVRIIGFFGTITWAVTQPTPLDVVLTVDGQSLVWTMANPVSAQAYEPRAMLSTGAGGLLVAESLTYKQPFLLEGRSIKVEAMVTWAITQPTPLVCRVKWAKIP